MDKRTAPPDPRAPWRVIRRYSGDTPPETLLRALIQAHQR